MTQKLTYTERLKAFCDLQHITLKDFAKSLKWNERTQKLTNIEKVNASDIIASYKLYGKFYTTFIFLSE